MRSPKEHKKKEEMASPIAFRLSRHAEATGDSQDSPTAASDVTDSGASCRVPGAHESHSPLPWRAAHSHARFGDEMLDVGIVADMPRGGEGTAMQPAVIAECFGRVDYACYPDAAANAAFIVRAVNSHDELVKALRNAVLTIRSWHGMGMRGVDETLAWKLYQQSPEMKEINAAIEKAGGR